MDNTNVTEKYFLIKNRRGFFGAATGGTISYIPVSSAAIGGTIGDTIGGTIAVGDAIGDAIGGAIGGATGILIQFPLYFGIMGIMNHSGLVQIMSDFFVNIS